jgi:hypothetical protein
MGERYLITGVQLSLLIDDKIEFKKKENMLGDIIDKQFITNSKNHITKDCEELRNSKT